MKTIIVYYSLEGNTEYAARVIAEQLGADLLRIEPTKSYPTGGFRKFFWGGKSAVMGETPELVSYSFQQASYGRVIFGFPVWAGNVTPPIRTFVKENDLKGKSIAGFRLSKWSRSGEGIWKAKVTAWCGCIRSGAYID